MLKIITKWPNLSTFNFQYISVIWIVDIFMLFDLSCLYLTWFWTSDIVHLTCSSAAVYAKTDLIPTVQSLFHNPDQPLGLLHAFSNEYHNYVYNRHRYFKNFTSQDGGILLSKMCILWWDHRPPIMVYWWLIVFFFRTVLKFSKLTLIS